MIQIKMRDDEWRIKIDEEWKFSNLQEMEHVLEDLINFKDSYGRSVK